VYLVIAIEPHSGSVVLSLSRAEIFHLCWKRREPQQHKSVRAPTFAGEISVKGYFISGAELLSFVAREREDTPL
jgi:hypothetical protein